MALNTQMILCLTSLIGIIPALFLLYYLLKTYDEYFKDNWLYGFFAGGLVLGMVAFALHAFIDPYALLFSIDLALLIFVLAYSVFEELAKYVILYYKKFQGSHDTTYYGISMGLGFGAASIISIAYQEFLLDPDLVNEQVLVLPTAVLLSIGLVGLHGTTGAMIGFGSSKKYKWRFLGWAIVFHMIFNVVLLAFRWTPYPGKIGEAFVMLLLALFGIYYVKNDIMPASLSKGLSRKRRRDIKRKRLEGRKSRVRAVKGEAKVTWKKKGQGSNEEE